MSGTHSDEEGDQTGLDDYGNDQAETEKGDGNGEIIWPPDAGDEE